MTNVLEFLEQAQYHASHDDIAFVGEDASVTYVQLVKQAHSIGSFFASRGIYKQPIAVLMNKSPQMINAFLGVLYGGNYYVPLDAAMPPARIKMILETVKPSMVICDETTSELAAEWQYETCKFADIRDHQRDEDTLLNIRRRAVDIDPVYVVFTSGSTGVPKGVVASHRAVIDYIETLCPVLDVDKNTVFGNQSPLYLDACLKEIFPALRNGAKTYLIPQSLFSFPVKLIEFINENGINTICWVASALSMVAGLGALEKNAPSSLKVVAFGSEVFPQKHLAKWREALPNTKFIHLYGPTETTGMAAYYVVNRDFAPGESIPIGKPFPNREIILLDDDGKVPDIGQPGEIHIRGSQLSLGYFADKSRTQVAFVQNPLSPFPDILYKTGDLGYQNSDGDFVFISRRDHQIKHMGHRIELTEIEAAARELDGMEIVCAVFDAEKSRIGLFYAAEIEQSQLRAHLKIVLPRYMQPQKIVKLETMPLTPGGKIDRVALNGGL